MINVEERLKDLRDVIRRNKIKACELISEVGKYILADDIEIVLNMLKEKDREIQDLKQALARNIAKNVTSSMKESAKSKDDLEMLSKGWQIELEKKDKIIDLMAEKIFKEGIVWEDKDDVKQYFEKLAERKMKND